MKSQKDDKVQIHKLSLKTKSKYYSVHIRTPPNSRIHETLGIYTAR